jgi:hypothetical protein
VPPNPLPPPLTHTHTHTQRERERVIAHISKKDNWPVRKSELVNKYLKQVIHFINSTDYEEL